MTSRTRWVWFAVGVVVAAMIGALVVVWRNREPSAEAPLGQAPAPATTATTVTGQQAAATACAPTAGMFGPMPTDPRVSYFSVDGQAVRLPEARGAGPSNKSGVPHCFSHSTLGAAMAAANFVAWLQPGGQATIQAWQALFVPDHNAAQMVSQMKVDVPTPALGLDVIGARVDNADANSAHVVVVMSVQDSYAAFPVDLRWMPERNDWGVVAPQVSTSPVYPVKSLSGEQFVVWRQ